MSAELPHAPEAEIAVVGSVLLDPDVLPSLELDPQHFHDPRPRAVFAAMREIERRGDDVDLVTLSAELRRMGKLEGIGGEPYLSEAAIATPTSVNVEQWAAIVRDRWVARQLVLRCAEIQERARRAEDDADTLLSHAQRELSAVQGLPPGEDVSIYAAIRAVVERIRDTAEKRARGEDVQSGIPVGLAGVDALISGLPLGVPIVVGGRPGDGKSTLALHLADWASHCGIGAHILSWEDRRDGWAERELARWSRIDVSRLRDDDVGEDEIPKLVAAVDRIGRRPWAVEHAHGMTADQAVRRVRARAAKLGTRLVLVDYVQLIPPPPGWERRKTHEVIDENMRVLSQLAYRDGLCLVVLSQLNRDASQGVPRKEDLKASGSLEEHAKLIMLLDRPRHEDGSLDEGRDDAMVIRVVKNHQGPRGLVEVTWRKSHAKLR